MNTEEREKFGEVLKSLDGNDLKKDVERLRAVINIPQSLFRFRSVSPESLSALQENKLYFTHADKYDDPFDSFLRFDIERVKNEIEMRLQTENMPNGLFGTLAKAFNLSPGYIDNAIRNLNLQQTQMSAIDTLQKVQKLVQQRIISACFSEDRLNETLWLKYADKHQGFVLEYYLQDDRDFLCRKQEICEKCLQKDNCYSIYPIYYADEKYDATEYARDTAIAEMARYLLANENQYEQFINSVLPPNHWEQEKIALIKNKYHEADREWRLLYPGFCVNDHPAIGLKPISVTIGLKTSNSAKRLIITLAQYAQIPRIYQCFINERSELDYELICQAKGNRYEAVSERYF